MKLALVTTDDARDLDHDLLPLTSALARRGHTIETPAWDDPGARWTSYDAVVVRSPWNYTLRRDDFVAWARSIAAPLLNAAGVLAWNTDKRYLEQLAARGVPTTPTTFVPPGQAPTLPAGEIVVKPTVSAGAKDTARYLESEQGRALAHVARLGAAGRTAMVQPYLASVDTRGETSLLFFGGQFSHAVTKGPLLVRGGGMVEGLFALERVAARAPTRDERAVAESTLDALPFARATLAYARVDLVLDDAGAPRVLELELTEPSVFLSWSDGAADRFAAAILTQLQS